MLPILRRRLLSRSTSLLRTMATASPKKEWLVLIPDRTEPGTLEKRIKIRPYIPSPFPTTFHLPSRKN